MSVESSRQRGFAVWWWLVLSGLLMVELVAAAPVWAELTPDQVGLIAMAESPEGQQLAQHYAQRRGVPKEHIFLLPGKPGDEMSQKDWETQARPAIRDWLLAEPRRGKIRCLVTCWDVPLRIGRRDPASPEVQARKQFLDQARANHVGQLEKVLAMIESVGQQEKPPTPPSLPPQIRRRKLASNWTLPSKRPKLVRSNSKALNSKRPRPPSNRSSPL